MSAMTELVLYEPPCIEVRLPPENPCEARDCEAPSTSVLFTITPDYRQLLNHMICGFHAWTLADKGAVVFPLVLAPSMEQVLHHVNMLIARRQQQVYQPTNLFYGGTGTYSSYTGSTTFGFSFG